ncbi:MAG TPA: HIT family protein [Phycisphaerae bacterium]|nr:HIT family protein [Phycisphaerae bacterium]
MPADPDCIFCKIAAGQIPARVVMQGPAWMAFLDVAPLSEGHVLVIPKDHYVRLHELPAEVAADMCAHLPSLGRAVLEATGAAGYNILQNNGRAAGQEVQHVHFHVIPRQEGDGLGYRWHPKSYAEGRAEQLHARLTELLGT